MDINYLYRREQVSLFMAEHAVTEQARSVHREFAERYSWRIAAARQDPAQREAS